MNSKVQIIFHAIVFSLMIIHIAICSDYFEGTRFWSVLTYSCEALFVIIAFQFFLSRESVNKIEKFGIYYFALLFLVSLAYGLSSSNIMTLIGRTMEIATMLMLFHLHKENITPLLIAGSITLSVGVYANCYLLLENPMGVYNMDGDNFYLLGTNYNQIGTKIIFAFILSAILLSKSKLMIINVVALGFFGLSSLLIVGSMTSVVTFSMLLFVFLNSWMTRLNNYIFKASICFIIIFQVFVVFLGSQIETLQVEAFIDILGKDMTFTGRTRLWARSAWYFWDSPIWGHGFITPRDYSLTSFFYGDHRNCHNLIYNIMHKGGLLLLFIFIQLLRVGFANIKDSLPTRQGFIVVMGAVVFFILTMFEVFDMFYVFLLVALMYYYPNIASVINKQSSNEIII